MRVCKAAALAAAVLVWGACSKPQEPAPAAAPLKPGWTAAPSAPTLDPVVPKAAVEPPREEVKPVAPPPPLELPKDFQVGQPREVVLGMLGDCAERMFFLPGGSGNLSVEIFQPKEGECRKRLGERRFTVTGGKLERVTPGVLAPKPPPGPRPALPKGV
jgi:hypothetical protein